MNPMVKLIGMGDKTNHQDQSITDVSFSTKNANAIKNTIFFITLLF